MQLAKSILLIAPHPDDETLATGGLIATMRQSGVEVRVVAVTDGENAYEGYRSLGSIREREQTEALGRLGVAEDQIVRFRLPDSNVSACEQRMFNLLMPLASEGVEIIAPWTGDFHPDHEACGRVAQRVCQAKNLPISWYFFWTWHRGTVASLAGMELLEFPLSRAIQIAKQDALLCHRTQLEHESGQPILPANLLGPAGRPFEVFMRA